LDVRPIWVDYEVSFGVHLASLVTVDIGLIPTIPGGDVSLNVSGGRGTWFVEQPYEN